MNHSHLWHEYGLKPAKIINFKIEYLQIGRGLDSLDFDHCYAAPWTLSWCLRDGNSLADPSTNIYASFLKPFDLIDLILLFACQICHYIVKQKIENKRTLANFLN